MPDHMTLQKLNNAELATFFSQMSYALKAGISPSESLSLLAEDSPSSQAAAVLALLQDNLEACGSFSRALADSALFPGYAVSMLTIGEYAGCLDDTCYSLCEHYQQAEDTRQTLKNAAAYPSVMILIMLAVCGILTAKVLPLFQEVYRQLGSQLSGLPLRLMEIGSFLGRYGFWLLLLITSCFLLYLWLLSHDRARIPFSRKLYRELALSRFTHSLGLLLASGVSSDEALDMLLSLTDDKLLLSQLQRCHAALLEGSSLPASLRDTGILSSTESHLLLVGLRSGTEDTVLKNISTAYRERADQRISRMLSLLEPLLAAILSVIVGVILLSVMLPLIGVLSDLGNY